jgi:4-diphosphocytidyl-2-C-methyl-D-erythritol kinase
MQAVAQKLCPDVSTALNWLEKQGLQPRMTGSGSAVFAHISEGEMSNFVKFENVPENAIVKLCGNLAEHPLKSWAN